jgi:hypothetical protein
MTDQYAAPPTDVHALLARIEDSWRNLLAALDGVPEERMTDPGACDGWSLKDLFGHLAFWDQHAVAEIDRALAGKPREDAAWQAMNDADYAARRAHPLPQQRSDMHQAHAALVERLEAIAGLDAEKLDAAVKPDTYLHYDEHVPDILAWRQRAGL